jgi:hypothetical protein
MIETEETQIYLSYNTCGNEGNKTGTDTFTVIISAIRKTKKPDIFGCEITDKLLQIK